MHSSWVVGLIPYQVWTHLQGRFPGQGKKWSKPQGGGQRRILFIGHAGASSSLTPHPSALDWKVGEGMDWNFAAVEFAKTVRARADFRDLIVDLEGKQLACTCPLDRLCHGDVLVRLFHEVRKGSLQQGGRRPVSGKEAREEAKRQSDA